MLLLFNFCDLKKKKKNGSFIYWLVFCFLFLMCAGMLPKLSISLQLIKTLVWMWTLEIKVKTAGEALNGFNCCSLHS